MKRKEKTIEGFENAHSGQHRILNYQVSTHDFCHLNKY